MRAGLRIAPLSLALAAVFGACAQPHVLVVVIFPSQADLDATDRIAIRVFDAAQDGLVPPCDALVMGAPPPDAIPPVRASFELAPGDLAPTLADFPLGPVRVLASAFDENSQLLLIGCADHDVNRGDETLVVELAASTCAGMADGTMCDDGLVCTLNDVCFDGACSGQPRDCSSADAGPCQPGVCDEATDSCITVTAMDGEACDDGDFCTDPDSCTSGVCGGGPRDCNIGGPPCDDGTCDPTLQGCIFTPLPEGANCVDPCAGAGICTANVCITPVACGNAPPVARFSVIPGGGDIATTFAFDASGSTDAEEPSSALLYEWDWDADGMFDDTGQTATQTFATPGLKTIYLRVTDSNGDSGWFTGFVAVADPSDLIIVTTGMDVVDAADGETSLREAIQLANSDSGDNTITFIGAMTVLLVSELPAVTDNGTDIVGQPGVAIDGTAITGDCMRLNSVGNVVLYLEIFGCSSDAMTVGGQGNQVAHCDIHSNGHASIWDSGGNNLFGPGLELHENGGHGIELNGGSTIFGNVIWDAGDGVEVSGSGIMTFISGNVFYDNDNAVDIFSSAVGVSIWHNTIVGTALAAIAVNGGSDFDIRNNIFAGNLAVAIDQSGTLAALDGNLFFENAGGDCPMCTLVDANIITADPRFRDPVNRDYRLGGNSPCIDAVMPTGYDTNGAAPGVFNGVAPDTGAWEAP